MSNRRDIQFMYNPHNKATMLDCNFIVDSSNASGVGVSSLNNSGRISSVFMNSSAAFTGTSHTSVLIDSIASTANLVVGMPVQGSGIPVGATIASIVNSTSITLSAATVSSTTGSITYQAVGNPNPVAGYIYVNLQDNYNKLLGFNYGIAAPISGTPINVTAGVTAGLVYTITSLGNTSTAQWHVLGVPANIAPAVGVSFVAPITQTATGTGQIQVPKAAASGISHIELIGRPNLMNSNGSYVLGGSNGMQLIFACYSLASVFSGSALGTHAHDLLIKGGQAASTTNDIAAYAGPVLGKEQAADATILGASSAANGGVLAASAGTPAGTIANSNVLAAPANLSMISMSFYMNNSAQGV